MLNLPSRRTFLKSLTLATAATLGSIEQIFSAIPKSALQGGFAVGPQSWTFRVFDVLTAIDKAAQAGAKAIELFPGQALSASDPKAKFGHDSTDDQVKLVKNHLASKGIQPVAYGVVGLSKDEKSSRKVFEFCKTMGIGIINSEPPAEALDTIEKLVREYDIKVGFHNHPKSEKNPNYLHWNPEWVLSVVKDRDPRIGACADTGHWLTSGLDPVAAIQRLGKRVVSAHLKDRANFAPPDVPFGTGTGKVKEVLDELVRLGFDGSLSIEYETKWDNNVDDVKQCVDFIRTYKA
jgi:sugar phosphate isomerase/epimerase